jgi:RNA polymerase sigma factor (sigma-70 family)
MIVESGTQTDEALYVLWAQGDPRAGRELVARRFEGVSRLIRSLLIGVEVEDATQQVFERLAKRAAGGEPIANVRAFIAGIARNVVRERLRAHARAPVDLEEQSLADLRPNQSSHMLMLEQHNVLLKALHRLPVDDQILLALRFWQRLRTRELAQVLGLEHATVRTRLRRAKAKLEALITELVCNGQAGETTVGSFDGWARDCARIREEPCTPPQS